MIYIFRWFFGYVKFSFKKGFREDFLSDCFEQGLELRNVEMAEDYITAVCNLKSYRALHRIAYKNGGVTKIISKKGLPFLTFPLKNRLGFFVGALCFVAIISFLNAFIWDIEIVGNKRVSDTAIASFLESNNFRKGAMWSGVDKEKLSWEMMSEFDELSWVHINEIGTTAVVEVNEKRDAPIADNDKLQGRDVFRRELIETVSREQKSIKLKNTKSYYNINFFTADIPLYFKRQSGDTTRKCSKQLEIRDKKLPIGYTEYEELTYSFEQLTLDDERLKALARKRMGYKELDELEGFEIVNKVEDYKLDDTKCVATFSYIIRRK